MTGVLIPDMTMHNELESRVRRLEKQTKMMVPDAFSSTMPAELTREKAAEFLRISPRSLDRLIANGTVIASRVGPGKGRVLVDVLSLCQHKELKGFSREHIDLLLKETVYGQ